MDTKTKEMDTKTKEMDTKTKEMHTKAKEMATKTQEFAANNCTSEVNAAVEETPTTMEPERKHETAMTLQQPVPKSSATGKEMPSNAEPPCPIKMDFNYPPADPAITQHTKPTADEHMEPFLPQEVTKMMALPDEMPTSQDSDSSSWRYHWTYRHGTISCSTQRQVVQNQ